MYNKVLVPLDGSKLSEKAMPYAKTIVSKTNSEIVLLSSYMESEGSEHALMVYLDRRADDLRLSGIKATSVIAHGNAADQILDFSETHNVDMIVMSTHGRTGTSRWSLGSVCTKVLYESYVPVMLIKTGAMPLPSNVSKSWKILVPLDGSQSSEASLPHVADVASGSGSEVILFGVNEAGDISGYANHKMDQHRESCNIQYMTEMQASIERYLEETKTKIRPKSPCVRSEIACGKPADEIIKYAESNDIDLIAMTSHGRSGSSHWAYGSVANKVAYGSPKPTLLLRSQPRILASVQ